MKKELAKILAYVLVGVLLCLNVYQCNRGRAVPTNGAHIDTLTVYDTVRVEIPAPKEEKPLGSVTAKLPVSVPKLSETKRKLPEVHQSLPDCEELFGKRFPNGTLQQNPYSPPSADHFEDTSEKVAPAATDDKEDNFPNKSEQKSGLKDEQKPDSVSVQIPITQRVYETEQYRAVVSGYRPNLDDLVIYQPTQVVRIKDKPKRWGIGVQVGYGMTVNGKPQFTPYIGIGVSYNLFAF